MRSDPLGASVSAVPARRLGMRGGRGDVDGDHRRERREPVVPLGLDPVARPCACPDGIDVLVGRLVGEVHEVVELLRLARAMLLDELPELLVRRVLILGTVGFDFLH